MKSSTNTTRSGDRKARPTWHTWSVKNASFKIPYRKIRLIKSSPSCYSFSALVFFLLLPTASVVILHLISSEKARLLRIMSNYSVTAPSCLVSNQYPLHIMLLCVWNKLYFERISFRTLNKKCLHIGTPITLYWIV